jgi:uncharacterized membrane protein YdjX (TVP38/TMEM64 family)
MMKLDNPVKVTLLALWVTVFSVAVYFYLSLGIPVHDIVRILREFVNRLGIWGPLLYVVLYSFRSLILFPASLLTAISGLVFGPWYGMLLTVVGENISGNISFIVGRYFGSGLVRHLGSKSRHLASLECRFRENGFLAVLTMRLMYMPFDFVGYMSGACNIRQRDFALGTVIGTIPGLATFVFLGSAITDPKNLVIAFLFFVVGWLISNVLKEKEKLNKTLSV